MIDFGSWYLNFRYVSTSEKIVSAWLLQAMIHRWLHCITDNQSLHRLFDGRMKETRSK